MFEREYIDVMDSNPDILHQPLHDCFLVGAGSEASRQRFDLRMHKAYHYYEAKSVSSNRRNFTKGILFLPVPSSSERSQTSQLWNISWSYLYNVFTFAYFLNSIYRRC